MQEKKLTKGKKVFFNNEKLPFNVMAISENYAVVSRKLNRREDAELLNHQVKMNAYLTFTEAFTDNKSNPVYSLLDFRNNVKAPHNLIFGDFDYFKDKDCERAIKWLEKGKMELSQRNRCELSIDWDKTASS
jgi:hypothetical protein